MSVIGSLAAFDHWRQRVYLIESVPVRTTGKPTPSTRPTTRRSSVSQHAATDLAGRCRTARRATARSTTRCRRSPASMPNGLYQQAVEVAKEHIVAGDIFQVVLAQRFDITLDADPFDVYSSAASGQPESVHVLPASSATSRRRLVAGADGAGARPQGDQRPIAGTRRRGAQRRPRPPHGRRAEGEPEGARRARHARRPGPQRRRPDRQVRQRARRRADDARALQPRHAPDVSR